MSQTLKLRQPCFSAANPRVTYVRRLNGNVEVYQGRVSRNQPFMHPDLVRLGMEIMKDYAANLEWAKWHRVFTKVRQFPGTIMVDHFETEGVNAGQYIETTYINL